MVGMTNELIPSDYQAFLQSIKTRVQQAQLKALVAVNRELILLYWQIGRGILERQVVNDIRSEQVLPADVSTCPPM